MMAIDMLALERAADGNPAAKVTVTKGWLHEVHRKLLAAARAEAELTASRRTEAMIDAVFGGFENRN